MKYKIEQSGQEVFLYKKLLGLFWVIEDSRCFTYQQHAIEIAKRWMKQYGRQNFV